jgi:adenylate cyclase
MPEANTSGSMGRSPDRRKLVAVVHADIVGYSRLIGLDDVGTLERLRALRRDVIDPSIAEHGGRIVNTAGDAFLIVFDSVDGAVRCAVKIQQQMPNHDGEQSPDRSIRFRVGINVGDVIVDGSDVHGDGVNVAARLQAECPAGGICISRAVHEHVRGRLDLPSEGIGPLNLKNINQPVEAFVLRPEVLTADKAVERTLVHGTGEALPLPDKPSIAVLPFQNMSGDPDQEYFADGVVEDITAALSRAGWLFVIARNSSFAYKGKSPDVRQVGRELGVRYVLEGSVRKAANRVRITGQLVDATSRAHVWAERYDRDLTDIFALQAEIAEAVTAAISPAVANAERQRARRKPPGNLNAWEAHQRGLWHLCQTTADDNQAAQGFFRQAIELDPTFARAYAGLSGALDRAGIVWHTRDLAEAQRLAEEYARRAVSLDGNDASAHFRLAAALVMRGDLRGAREEAQRALAIDPNEADAYGVLGVSLLYDGEPEKGLVGLEEQLRRDPFGPASHSRRGQVAIAHYLRGDYEAAVAAARQAIRLFPGYSARYRWLSAALGQLGRIDEASEVLAEAASFGSADFDGYARQRPPWLRPEDHEHMLAGLRKAGWQG